MQTVQTPAQYCWLTKLLGFNFEIECKPGITNKLEYALSCLSTSSCQVLHLLSKLVSARLDALRHFYTSNPTGQAFFFSIYQYMIAHLDFFITNVFVLYDGRIFIPPETSFRPFLLNQYHNTPFEGRTGIQRMVACFSAFFYWPKMQQLVKIFYLEMCHMPINQTIQQSTPRPSSTSSHPLQNLGLHLVSLHTHFPSYTS